MSALNKEDRNAIYNAAGNLLNEALNSLVAQFPGVLVSELISTLHIKAGEKSFAVSVNPLLRALCEYMQKEPSEFLNEVAKVSGVERRYLGVQELDNGTIFKINNIKTSPETVQTIAQALRTEYTTIIAEQGFKSVRDRQRNEGLDRQKSKNGTPDTPTY
jgi:hypothetical protein